MAQRKTSRAATRRAGGRRRPGRAFTLIEILIVIAIIALLVTILVPSLSRAYAIAKDTLCRSRLRHWGIGFELYSAENDGFFPHIDSWDRGRGGADDFGWVDVIPPLIGRKPWREHPPWHRPMEGSFLQCPAARYIDSARYGYNGRRNGFFSIAMNSCLELDRNCWPPPGRTGWPMPSFLNTMKIDDAERAILLFDQLLDPRRGYGGARRNRSAGQYCGSYPKAFSARHAVRGGKLGGFILHCDYHVEWVETVWKKDWPADLEVPPRDDADWFPYPAD